LTKEQFYKKKHTMPAEMHVVREFQTELLKHSYFN